MASGCPSGSKQLVMRQTNLLGSVQNDASKDSAHKNGFNTSSNSILRLKLNPEHHGISSEYIGKLPEMGVLPNHPNLGGISHEITHPAFLRYPHDSGSPQKNPTINHH